MHLLALWTEATHAQFLLEIIVQSGLSRLRKVTNSTWRFKWFASLKALLVVLGDLYILEHLKAVQDATGWHRPLRKVSLWCELCGFSLLSRERSKGGDPLVLRNRLREWLMHNIELLLRLWLLYIEGVIIVAINEVVNEQIGLLFLLLFFHLLLISFFGRGRLALIT